MTEQEPAITAKPAFSAYAFDILRCAVRIARDEQIKKVNALRSRLETMFPASDQDIDMALTTWANMAVRSESPSR